MEKKRANNMGSEYMWRLLREHETLSELEYYNQGQGVGHSASTPHENARIIYSLELQTHYLVSDNVLEDHLYMCSKPTKSICGI